MVKKDINYYLNNPNRLLDKKAFTRGGEIKVDNTNIVNLNGKTPVNFSNLRLKQITQDTFLQEYEPSLHKILHNRSIPKIAVKVGDRTITIDELVITSSLQKNIHAAHTLHLATNPMEFVLCNYIKTDDIADMFKRYKQEWLMRNMEKIKYDCISSFKSTSDVGLLFRISNGKGKVKVLSYKDGYIVIPNYNEFGERIATSLYYQTDDGTRVIDTYTDTMFYRHIKNGDMSNDDNNLINTDNTDSIVISDGDIISDSSEWHLDVKGEHGFTRCPLLYHRGRVAWDYAESLIEMWELMVNIYAVVLKRFGSFGLIFKGQYDQNSFLADSTMLIINVPNPDEGQDAKVIDFPEPKGMIEYLDFLLKQISIASSTTFITPDSLRVGGDIGGNAIQLAMKNDLALATQSVNDWAEFTDDMAKLFAEMLTIENDGEINYNELAIKARLSVWTPESTNTKVTNLNLLQNILSKETLIEQAPYAAPDEIERKEKEAEIENKLNEEEKVTNIEKTDVDVIEKI